MKRKFKEGDIVVPQKFESSQLIFRKVEMGNLIGKKLPITDTTITATGDELYGVGGWWWPASALTLAVPASTVAVPADGKIPFDLGKALAGEEVITDDGTLIEDIYQFKKIQSSFNVIAQINGYLHYYDERGGSGVEKSLKIYEKLYMKQKQKEYWTNVFRARATGAIFAEDTSHSKKSCIDMFYETHGTDEYELLKTILVYAEIEEQ